MKTGEIISPVILFAELGKGELRMVLIKIIKVMEIVLSCMAIFILIFAVICLIFQFKPAVVVSGSMEPAIKTGSFFLIDKIMTSRLVM